MFRLYLPPPLVAGTRVRLGSDHSHYLSQVLRLRVGDGVLLFDGGGGEWPATVVVAGKVVELELGGQLPERRDGAVELTLVQGLAKPAAMELVIQKGTELGVSTIIPLLTRRSVIPAAAAGRQERWRRIAIEAAEQSRRVTLPTLHPPTTWEQLPALLGAGPRWLFWEEATALPEWRHLPPVAAHTCLIGPEGGLSAEEVSRAEQVMGFTTFSLGPRTLRTETAALAVITLLGTLLDGGSG